MEGRRTRKTDAEIAPEPPKPSELGRTLRQIQEHKSTGREIGSRMTAASPDVIETLRLLRNVVEELLSTEETSPTWGLTEAAAEAAIKEGDAILEKLGRA